jgi:hypothetical protein
MVDAPYELETRRLETLVRAALDGQRLPGGAGTGSCLPP